MKKLFIIIFIVFLTFTLAACSENLYTTPQATELSDTFQEEDEENIKQDVSDISTEAEDELDDLYLSPRTAVTGLLASSQSILTEISVAVNLGWSSEEEYLIWEERSLGIEDAEMVHRILATMDATEVLTPTHIESQQADTMFRIIIQYDDGSIETVYSIWGISTFYRYTGTYGSHGDPGYVVGMSEDLRAFLVEYFK